MCAHTIIQMVCSLCQASGVAICCLCNVQSEEMSDMAIKTHVRERKLNKMSREEIKNNGFIVEKVRERVE